MNLPNRRSDRQGVGLTCALCSQEVLALRFIGVDGGNRHDVGRVRLQVLQQMGGFIAVQDGLRKRGNTRRSRVSQVAEAAQPLF